MSVATVLGLLAEQRKMILGRPGSRETQGMHPVAVSYTEIGYARPRARRRCSLLEFELERDVVWKYDLDRDRVCESRARQRRPMCT